MRTKAGQDVIVPFESVDSNVVWDMLANGRFTERFSSYVKVDNLLDETCIAARRPAGVRPELPRTACLGMTYRL
jgi:Fe(3+) dicitrate transport protein